MAAELPQQDLDSERKAQISLQMAKALNDSVGKVQEVSCAAVWPVCWIW